MTQEDKDRLKELLFQKKAITYDGYHDDDPFVGIYLNELVKLLDEYESNR